MGFIWEKDLGRESWGEMGPGGSCGVWKILRAGNGQGDFEELSLFLLNILCFGHFRKSLL